ncbi:MAG: nucleotidyltransferase domain-containing protein [Terriglobales bacterium]
MGTILEYRRKATKDRIADLQRQLALTKELCGEHGCVYATGSFARGEASKHSDLDLFIVSRLVDHGKRDKEPSIRNLNQILIKADLIRATKELGIEEFSGDGEYLTHYTVEDLIATLGKRHDDSTNTFTARLLLLLESFPLIGEPAYQKFTESVVKAYWKDYAGREAKFMPAFLTNDVLRMWRTFCVNYESGTPPESTADKAKRKLKNYKLKHSRMLSCYSALFYLLATFSKNGTVTPADAGTMISLSPSQRLEWMLDQPELKDAYPDIRNLIARYEEFLTKTEIPKEELIPPFVENAGDYLDSARQFGDLVFSVLQAIGRDREFYRVLVV